MRNLVTVALGIVAWTVPVQTCSNDIWFSYLPMAHIFERIVHAALMVVGAQFWFSSGDLKKMLDELQIVKPTIFGAVPRVMNRIGTRTGLFVGRSVYTESIFWSDQWSPAKAIRQNTRCNE